MNFYDLVVIGGGMAAMAAVKTFRATDSVSSILMVSDQPDMPVRKPPLSKQLWSGEMTVPDIFYNPAKFKTTFSPKTTVTSLDFNRRLLKLSNGEKVRYNQLLLATGLTPRKLPGSFDGLIYFNNLADYRRLRNEMATASSIVVIGGGLLAIEMAAALAAQKQAVQLVFPGRWPLDRYLPESLGKQVVDRLVNAGISCRAEARVTSVSPSGEVALEDGNTVSGDLILPLIGQQPSLDFLAGHGIDYSTGLAVDEQLKVIGLDDVYACGDIVSVAGFRERCPHEDNALRSGSHVGQVMTGSSAIFRPSTFLYSEFLGLRLESIGFGRARDSAVAVERWEDGPGRGMAILSKDGLIERLTLINYKIESEGIEHLSKRMIGKRCTPDAADMIRFVLKVAA